MGFAVFEDKFSMAGENGRQTLHGPAVRDHPHEAKPQLCPAPGTHPAGGWGGGTMRSSKNNFGELTNGEHVCPMETVVDPGGLTQPRRALPETC